MNTRPIVSIITPTYNSFSSLEQLVKSIENQTHNDFEHIVINDASSDDSKKFLKGYTKRNPHFKYINLPQNKGAGYTRNTGIRMAEGRYIMFLDSDDQWLPEKIEAQINFMEEKQCLLSYGDYSVITPQGKITGVISPPDELNYSDLLNKCPIGCLTAAYNQEKLGKQYMPLVRRGQDWGLWLAITKKGVTAHKYPGNFAIYMNNNQSLSKNKLKKSIDMLSIYRDQEKMPLHKSLWHLGCFTVNTLKKQTP